MTRALDRIVDFLAPLGFLVIVGAYAWQRWGRTLPVREEWFLGAGLFLILLNVVLRWRQLVAAVGRRQMKFGTNMAVAVLAVLGLLVALNYLAYRQSKKWDLTKGQRFSLSDQTRKILAGLEEDVRLVYFQRTAEMGPDRSVLEQYAEASPRVTVDYVDPLRNPSRAQEYDARGPWPIVVVERGDKRERVNSTNEQDLTNAFVRVTREGTRRVCFAWGQGERDLEDTADKGYSELKAVLERHQYETERLLLARQSEVPPECTVLVVPGPENDLLPTTVEVVRAYASAGGKVMVMVEPALEKELPNVTSMLERWSIGTSKDVVVDVSPMGQLFGTGPLTPIAASYPQHEITKDFRVMTAFHTARSIQAREATGTGVTTQIFVETSPASWAETDLRLQDLQLDRGADSPGPVPLAVVATLPAPGPSIFDTDPSPAPDGSPAPEASPSPSPSPGEGDESKPRTGRVAVFGDADFVSNALLGFQGNQDLFLNTVAWLAEDEDLISIRPREPEDQRLFLTAAQQQQVRLISLILLPGIFIVLGVWTWWKRR